MLKYDLAWLSLTRNIALLHCIRFYSCPEITSHHPMILVTNLEIRVKTRPNGDSQKKQEQNKDQNKDQKQEQKQENKDIVSSMLQKFGVRVK
jgi:hypothetical protein